MRLILLALSLLVAAPASAAAPALLGEQAWDVCERGVRLAPQRSECQDFPLERGRVLQWAKKVEAEIEEELK